MTLCISEKGARVVQLIRALRAAGTIMPGDKVRMSGKKPAAYVGPVMEGSIQMHAFRLFDGMEVVLELPALDRDRGPEARLLACAAAGPASQ